MQRVGPLAGLPALVAELGGDVQRVFAASGLQPDDLRAGQYIPLSAFIELLDLAAAATGRQDFALQLGLRQSPESLGPLGLLMRSASTLGQALSDFVSFQIDNSRGAAAYLHRAGDDFCFGIGIYDQGYRAAGNAYDLACAVGCSVIRHLTAGKVEPAEVLLIRREPSDAAPYVQAARCPVRFNQAQSCIILPARSMEFELSTADPVQHAQLLKLMNERLSRAPWGVSGQVRHALRGLILLGKHSLPDVARALGQHPRTLERHLDQEGTSFDVLKNDVRFALARDLLSLTTLPVGEIGASLGYATHSSFVHAFQRWTGTAPSAWRRALLSGPGSLRQPQETPRS